MDIFTILTLLGGVGLFVYGMNMMGKSLERLAGSGLEKVLERLTTSKKKWVGRLKGWGLGIGVTAIIQSSAATGLMLVGFITAGIMKLSQAIPVVFGANVGSTITAQILRLGDLKDDNLIFQLLQPSAFAPMLVGTGAFILIITKNKKAKDVANVLIGLGVLFYGMNLMEGVFEPLKDSAKFQHLFVSFKNPMLGILAGIIVTLLLQSSNTSVGILQALSATGTVTFATAFPIIVGQNIGKCGSLILGSIGSNKRSKRLVVVYILFNVFGAILACTVIYFLYNTVGIKFWDKACNRGDIANIHFLFNFVTSLIFLPLSKQMEKLSGLIIKEDTKPSEIELQNLDDMLLITPTIALEQCKKVISLMSDAILENYDIATGLIWKYDEEKVAKLNENESFIDKCETTLAEFVVKINSKHINQDEQFVVSEILNSTNDFERMGDYCVSIAYVASDIDANEITFSSHGREEIDSIIQAVRVAITTTFDSFSKNEEAIAVRVEPLADVIDNLREIIKENHVERLQDGRCGVNAGVALIDMTTAFERISSHAANIAMHVVKRIEHDSEFDDMHGRTNDKHSVEYKALYQYYDNKYVYKIREKKYTDNYKVKGYPELSEEKSKDDKKDKKRFSSKDKHNKDSKHDKDSKRDKHFKDKDDKEKQKKHKK
ncbi:MAG: Na/Pi cotransporter family protein [Lachnospiraceae bacterium]|nr:Na/Pi cotransporter family protein [Lachnospiraceae bacterium]